MVLVVAGPCEDADSHGLVTKRMDFMVCELHLSNTEFIREGLPGDAKGRGTTVDWQGVTLAELEVNFPELPSLLGSRLVWVM